jgi:predicted transcriptional regulator
MATKTKQKKRRTWLMPQEVEVWYVLPSIRRELTRMFIAKEIPQKTIAQMLGVTEPAVTQYKLEKSTGRSRGDQVQIPKKLLPEIEKSVDVIIKAWENKAPDDNVYEEMTREVNRLIKVLRDAGILCEVHRNYCEGVHDDCAACKDGRR